MSSDFIQPADRVGGPLKKTGRNNYQDKLNFINLSRDELFRMLFRSNQKQTKKRDR